MRHMFVFVSDENCQKVSKSSNPQDKDVGKMSFGVKDDWESDRSVSAKKTKKKENEAKQAESRAKKNSKKRKNVCSERKHEQDR